MEQGVIQELREMAGDADIAKRIVAAPAEPKHVYYVAEDGPDGIKLTAKTASRPAYRERASSIETLVEWLKEQKTKKPEVWYSRRAVIGGEGAASPQADICTFALTSSPQLSYLIGVAGEAGGKSFGQASLIRILRTTLFGTFGGDLLNSVRKVNLQKSKDVTAQQNRGKVSLERKDIAEMSGAADIPEVVAFDVPIFSAANIPCRAVIQCDLDLNADTEQFVLTVLPGEIEKAFSKGEAWLLQEILEQVGKDAIAVYYGEPGCA